MEEEKAGILLQVDRKELRILFSSLDRLSILEVDPGAELVLALLSGLLSAHPASFADRPTPLRYLPRRLSRTRNLRRFPPGGGIPEAAGQ